MVFEYKVGALTVISVPINPCVLKDSVGCFIVSTVSEAKWLSALNGSEIRVLHALSSLCGKLEQSKIFEVFVILKVEQFHSYKFRIRAFEKKNNQSKTRVDEKT